MTPKHFRQSSATSTVSGEGIHTPPQPQGGGYWESYGSNQQSPVSRSVSVPRNPSVGGASSRSASLASNKTRSSTSIPSITGSKTPKASRKGNKGQANSAGGQEAEKTVTIKCQRLTADKTYEEIEVEVPAPIYETIQLYNDTGSLAARATSSKERRKSIGTKLKNLFVKN